MSARRQRQQQPGRAPRKAVRLCVRDGVPGRCAREQELSASMVFHRAVSDNDVSFHACVLAIRSSTTSENLPKTQKASGHNEVNMVWHRALANRRGPAWRMAAVWRAARIERRRQPSLERLNRVCADAIACKGTLNLPSNSVFGTSDAH
eukprot:2316272-Pleurochrysis_carterae.AAC.5